MKKTKKKPAKKTKEEYLKEFNKLARFLPKKGDPLKELMREKKIEREL